MHVTRSFERWIDARWSRRNASIRELTLDLSLLPSTLLIDVGRSMQPGPRVNSSTHPSVSIFRHIRNETVCDINGAAYYRNRVWQIIERRERKRRKGQRRRKSRRRFPSSSWWNPPASGCIGPIDLFHQVDNECPRIWTTAGSNVNYYLNVWC